MILTYMINLFFTKKSIIIANCLFTLAIIRKLLIILFTIYFLKYNTLFLLVDTILEQISITSALETI